MAASSIVSFMPWLIEVAALHRIEEQCSLLDSAMRSVLEEAQSACGDLPTVSDDEAWDADVEEARLTASDNVHMAQEFLRTQMGIVPVLLWSHVEKIASRVYRQTRNRPLQSMQWDRVKRDFKHAHIDLTSLPEFGAVDAVRKLANCYKHHAGRPRSTIVVPGQGTVDTTTDVDFSKFDYQDLAARVVRLLGALGTEGYAKKLPSGTPEVLCEATTDGFHRLTRVTKLTLVRPRLFDIAVSRTLDNKVTELRFSIIEGDVPVLIPAAEAVKATTYSFQFLSACGELGTGEPLLVAVSHTELD